MWVMWIFNLIVLFKSKEICNCDGFDHRPITEQNIINDVYTHMKKYELLKKLRNSNIGDNDKLRLIYASRFCDELNLNIVTGSNYTKGLKW